MAIFMGLMRVKNSRRWVEEAIESLLRLCNFIYILDDHSEDNTVEICEKFKQQVMVFRSPFSDFDEARDKTWLLAQAKTLRPNQFDWAIMVDGDEILEADGPNKIQRYVQENPTVHVLRFPVPHYWDNSERVRSDGSFGSITRASAWRVSADVETFGNNGYAKCGLHCGSIPTSVISLRTETINVALWHYGYLEADDRLRKVSWYRGIDNANPNEGGYLHSIQGDPGGPPPTAKLKHAGPLAFETVSSLCTRRGFSRRPREVVGVSVVITTYNRPRLLGNTLRSIRSQKFQGYEIVVVDDGDDLETPAICKQYGTEYIKLVRPPSASYRNAARPLNVGIRQSKGAIIILQNAECQHVGHEVIYNLSIRVTDETVVFANVLGMKEDGTPDILYCGKDNPRPFFFCGAIKRKWFESLRGFDEDFTDYGYEDDDFADRIGREGVFFEFTDLSVHHQWHAPVSGGILGMGGSRALFDKKQSEGTVRNLNRNWGSLSTDLPIIWSMTASPACPPKVSHPRGYKYAKDTCTIDWWDTHKR